MNTFGLIGFPLAHSFSPEYFRLKFIKEGISNWQYKAFELPDINSLDLLLKDTSLKAFNITIPYKTAVLDFCQEQSTEINEIGAANLAIRIGERWKAFNTDWIGFMKSLEINSFTPFKKAAILGDGGASKAILFALHKMDIPYVVMSRKNKSLNAEKDLSSFDLIINCTPVGTKNHPKQSLKLNYESATENCLFYDLVYNPGTTEMMNLFAERNCKTMNGYEMLKLQAEAAWDLVKLHHS